MKLDRVGSEHTNRVRAQTILTWKNFNKVAAPYCFFVITLLTDRYLFYSIFCPVFIRFELYRGSDGRKMFSLVISAFMFRRKAMFRRCENGNRPAYLLNFVSVLLVLVLLHDLQTIEKYGNERGIDTNNIMLYVPVYQDENCFFMKCTRIQNIVTVYSRTWSK